VHGAGAAVPPHPGRWRAAPRATPARRRGLQDGTDHHRVGRYKTKYFECEAAVFWPCIFHLALGSIRRTFVPSGTGRGSCTTITSPLVEHLSCPYPMEVAQIKDMPGCTITFPPLP